MEITSYKHSCIVDASDNYIVFVRVILKEEDGEVTEIIEGHTLAEGESLVDIPYPSMCQLAGKPGLVHPRLDRGNMAWFESATPEEIAAWELAHPAPTTPSAPTLDQRTAALEAAMLAMMGGGLDV